jgi:hypothetical protein
MGGCGTVGDDEQADSVPGSNGHRGIRSGGRSTSIRRNSSDRVARGSTTGGTVVDRERRLIDQWWGDGACYANDDATHVVNFGMVFGNHAYVRIGEDPEEVATFLTNILQITNAIYRAQMNVIFRVTVTVISTQPGELALDSEYRDPASTRRCNKSTRDHVNALSDYAAEVRIQNPAQWSSIGLWHFF